MKALLTLSIAVCWMAAHPVAAQHQSATAWSVFDAGGRPSAVDSIINSAQKVDVVLVGELHDDTLGHRFRHELIRHLHASLGRPIAVSLEMFEQDVQLVVDEYLAGIITEQHFLAASRPWPNYARDYRPYIEFAKERAIPVVAANTPRRYVNMVAREGLDALSTVFGEALHYLPSLPLPPVSDAYRASFFERMEDVAGHGDGHGPSLDHLFDAQRLWDAGMAESIVTQLDRSMNPLVIHVAGAFHVENRTGIPDMLEAFRPGIRMLVVAVRPDDAFEPMHQNVADFIVLSGAISE
ncbi:MAG: ChaN family lipoprotein [Bacteroidota bacterium]